MPLVVGVAFKPVTKVYYFDPAGNEDLQAGDRVVVDTARGRTLGLVVQPVREVPAAEISGTLKPVLRCATALDMVQQDQQAHREPEALNVCRERVVALRLPMKIVGVEYNFEGTCLLAYFTAEQRIDFRNLVHELAQALHVRIEMRQIGVRDAAKSLGGYGRCGRQLCCRAWLRDFTPVSIKMAKQQDLPLNPTEISGLCGRLLCCLSYENESYGEARRYLPKVNSTIETPEGPGKVKQVHVLRNSVSALVLGPNDSKMMVEVPISEAERAAFGARSGCAGCPQSEGQRKRLLASGDDEAIGGRDEGELPLDTPEGLEENQSEAEAFSVAEDGLPPEAPPEPGQRSRARGHPHTHQGLAGTNRPAGSRKER
jgi:cell fate regulator YaaT (PSP1 superfamily)